MRRTTILILLGMAAVAKAALPVDAAPVQLEDVELLASDGDAEDHFGNAVAISGDVLVVGRNNANEPVEEGAAYVFERDEDGVWVEVAILSDADPDERDSFAHSVAVDGDLIVVGARVDNERTVEGGAAHVFERQLSGEWSPAEKLFGSGAVGNALFGSAVAISGETVVVGTRYYDDLGEEAGAAWVFERTGTGTWLEVTKLIASDGKEGDFFGAALAIDGDTLVVGASGVDDQGPGSGAAYVFERLGGVWTEAAKLLSSDGLSGDGFGGHVAVDGGVVAVGATGRDDLGPASGAAYVFQRDAGGIWKQTAKLLSPDGRGHDEFGYVSVDGDTIVVGSESGRTAPGVNSGTADVFRLVGRTTWAHIARLFPSDPVTLDQFGRATAIDGGTVAIGARLHDHLAHDVGSAYVYSLEEAWIDLRLDSPTIQAGEELRVEIRLEPRRPGASPSSPWWKSGTSESAQSSSESRQESALDSVNRGGFPTKSPEKRAARSVACLSPRAARVLHLWIEDGDGEVIASRKTPLTFAYGDKVRRELTLRIPEGTPAGEYRVFVGAERMQQGLAGAERSFTVLGPAPPTLVPPSR